MTTEINNRIIRRPMLPGLVALIGLLGLIGLSGPESAKADSVPYYESGQYSYDAYGLAVSTPRVMRPYRQTTCHPHGELVKWRPSLYRWNGRRWKLYLRSNGWYHAVTSIYGYCTVMYQPAWTAPNWAPARGHRFGPLRAGYYKIQHNFYWPSLGRIRKHSTNWFRIS
jgi:hypothetical protein